MTMEGRWKRLIAASLLFSSLGCSYFRSKKTTIPSNTGEPPLGVNSAQPVEEKRVKDDAPMRIDTLLALGSVRVQAANDPKRTSSNREELLEQARTIYAQALQREPQNVEVMLGMARLYHVMREKEKCLEWYQKAAKQAPNRADTWHEMGFALSAGFKDSDSALKCFHTATKLDPENRKYRKSLGFSLAYAARYEESYAWLSRCMSPAEAHYNIGRMMDHNGQHEQASQAYTLALKADPSHEWSKMALNNTQPTGEKSIPDATVIQTVGYDQVSPLPVSRPQQQSRVSQMNRTEPQVFGSQRDPGNPTFTSARPIPATPGMMTTSGWDR